MDLNELVTVEELERKEAPSGLWNTTDPEELEPRNMPSAAWQIWE